MPDDVYTKHSQIQEFRKKVFDITTRTTKQSNGKCKKKRVENYDPKLKIKGTFGDVIKVAMTDPPSTPVKAKEAVKKKSKGNS